MRIFGLLVTSILISLAPSSAEAGKRVALVIGNSGYTVSVGPLNNPGRDADLIANALRARGFAVTLVKDADRVGLLSAVEQYAASLAASGPDGVGFLYYSGHGAANPDTGRNYIIPVDAKSASDNRLWLESVPLQEVIDAVATHAGGTTNIVVFDACRDALRLPGGGKSLGSGGKGLVRVSERASTLIAFSTSPNAVAADQDRSAATGPYATELARHLALPNVDVKTMFDNVKFAVFNRTGEKQLPWTEDGLTRRVWLSSPPPGPSDQLAAAAVSPAASISTAAGGELGTIETISDRTTTMGIEITTASADAVRANSLSLGSPAILITAISNTSKAKDVGLQPGDLILSINKQVVGSPVDMIRIIETLKDSGRGAALLWISREGKRRFLPLPIK